MYNLAPLSRNPQASLDLFNFTSGKAKNIAISFQLDSETLEYGDFNRLDIFIFAMDHFRAVQQGVLTEGEGPSLCSEDAFQQVMTQFTSEPFCRNFCKVYGRKGKFVLNLWYSRAVDQRHDTGPKLPMLRLNYLFEAEDLSIFRFYDSKIRLTDTPLPKRTVLELKK